MRLSTILDPSCVILDVGQGSKHDILARLAAPIAALKTDLNADAVISDLDKREAASSTAIADGIAIPHAKSDSRDMVTASFGRSREGVDFDSIDQQPTHHFFLLVVPDHSGGQYLKALARISRFFRDPSFRQMLNDADSLEDVVRIIEEEDAKL